jgi:hypothetical protein
MQFLNKAWARFLRHSRKKPGFAGLRYRSGPAGALRAPSNPSRGEIALPPPFPPVSSMGSRRAACKTNTPQACRIAASRAAHRHFKKPTTDHADADAQTSHGALHESPQAGRNPSGCRPHQWTPRVHCPGWLVGKNTNKKMLDKIKNIL